MTPAGIVEDEAVETAVEPLTERIALQGRSLREHTARGAIINTLFQAGVGVLGLVQRVAVAALLTITEYGLWGLIVTALITLAWLKQIGIADKFVQQDEPDQEAAFQKAFTLELAYSAIFFAIACVVFPVLGAIYGHMEIVVPGIVLALSLVISAAETPIWIAYRQMRFVRQRVLESIDPVVSATVTIVLAIAGLGYWSLVLGPVAGSICGGIAAVTTSPYPLRLRWDERHAARVLLVLLAAARVERQRAGDRAGLGADRQLHRRPRRARRARARDHLLDVRRPARLADPAGRSTRPSAPSRIAPRCCSRRSRSPTGWR